MATKKPAAAKAAPVAGKAAGKGKTPVKKVASKKTPPVKRPAIAKSRGPIPTAQMLLEAAGTEAIVTLITEGATYRGISARYGVGLATLVTWIGANPERSRACACAREASAQAHEERAEEDILNASDPFELAKAKELAVHRRWRAKVVNPKQYGDKVDVSATMDIRTVSDEAIAKQLATFGMGVIAAKQLGLEVANAG